MIEGEAVPPCNIEAETKFIGTILLDQSNLFEIMLDITPEAFYDRTNRTIFSVICSLHADNKPITIDTIAQEVKAAKTPQGDPLYVNINPSKRLLQSLEGVASGEQDFWKATVREEFERRSLFYFTEEVFRDAVSGRFNPDQLRTKIEEGIVSLFDESGPSTVPIANAHGELEKRLERYFDENELLSGMSCGYRSIDEAMDGLQPGNVTIVYAPSSSFKSLFVTNIGYNLAKQGHPGLWFTTEMPRVQVMERLLQIDAGLNLKRLRRNYQIFSKRSDIKRSQDSIEELPIIFCDKSALDISDLRAETARNKRWKNIKYIIVDLVDHVSSSKYGDEMVNNQRVVMSQMKAIAKELDVHVLLVSHVTKGDKEIRKQVGLDIESMIGSSAKYQDVDVAINIHPCLTNPESGDVTPLPPSVKAAIMSEYGIIECQVAIMKNRHGELMFDLMEVDLGKGGRILGGGFYDRQEALDIEI